MHKIFFEKRCIAICSPDDPALSDPNAITYYTQMQNGIHDLVKLFQYSDSIQRLYIPDENSEDTYKRLCKEFKEVNAAGGLVTNRRGDCLLIRRNGIWDLPKGHQDEGEDIRITATREVQEETGVEDLITGDLICITDHCYFRNGIWHLKHTWWYDMLYTAPVELIPQKEEDISQAVWIAKSNIQFYLTDTYQSIAEVLNCRK